ncbi:MAG: TonB-dependent receptor [Candidatus Aminicenantes bacterium]|nr:TonB-dependent receptor [Candidatus Aminicenantes bacterium]
MVDKSFSCFKRLVLIILLTSTFLLPEIVEKVEVKERIFSHEFNSKDMIIISDKDLKLLKIKNFTDLYSFITVLNVHRRGQSDSTFDLSMRGSNFEQVLMLVNGIPMNNPQTGHFNSGLAFTVQDIERIEIIRGGSSTTYGAGAFAGVVNIILKRKSEFHFTVSGGKNDFFSSILSVGKVFKNFNVRLSWQRNNSSGFYPGQEFDLYRLSLAASFTGKETEIGFFTGYLNNDFGAAGFYADYPSLEEMGSFFSQFLLRKIFKRITCSFTVSYNTLDDFFTLDRYEPDFFQNQSLSKQIYLNFSFSYKLKRIKATGGLEFKNESMESSSMGYHRRNRWTIYLNTNYLLKKGGIDAGIRSNHISDENSNLTFYAGIYHHIASGLIFKAGCGKSFRIPSFTELYYESPANIGNPELKPEVSFNFETSLSLLTHQQSITLALFYRNQKNVIDWIKLLDNEIDMDTIPWEARNIEKNDVTGFEINYRLNLKRAMVIAGVEKLFVINRNSGFQSKYGLRFPDLCIKTSMSYKPASFFGITAQYLYKRIYQTIERGHFLNLIFGLYFKNVEISLGVDNVFKTIIEEIPGLKTPGRWIYFSIVYHQ